MKKMTEKMMLAAALMMTAATAHAQIGEYRNTLSVGGSAGLVMNTVGFTPKVNQKMHQGTTFGLTMRYTCEKYFSTICAVQAEVNYVRAGWQQDILNLQDEPVINTATGVAETYQRHLDYIQIPLLAHLGWGREQRGMKFFVQAGPQVGFLIGETTESSYAGHEPNTADRANQTVAQESMPVENKLDYGIAAGAGLEYSHPKVGHFVLEARYYYGLSNLYGDSKKDYFAKSNNNLLTVKLAYLFDITK